MSASRRGLLLGGAALALAGGGAAQPAGQRAILDAAGRRVAVPMAPRLVFPAGPGAAVLILALVPDRLAGWTAPPSAPMRSLLPPALVDRPVLGRLTGTQPTADAARVRTSGADLVLDMGTVNAAYAALADTVQAASGVPTVLLDGALPRSAELFRDAGVLLGATSRGEALAQLAARLLADTTARLAGWSAPRLWFGRGERGLAIVPGGSIGAEVPEMLGCRLPSRPAGDGTATQAALAAFDPEVALVTDAAQAQAMRGDLAWQATMAGRAGRFLVMPNGPFGWVDGPPSVQRLLGLRWLLSALRPDTLPPATMRADCATLLGLLFGIAADEATIARLTGG